MQQVVITHHLFVTVGDMNKPHVLQKWGRKGIITYIVFMMGVNVLSQLL